MVHDSKGKVVAKKCAKNDKERGGLYSMVVELCLAIIVFIPVIFIGVAKPRKAAEEYWNYMCPISYSIIPSRHDNPG